MTTLREEVGNAAESINKVSSTLMDKREVTNEIVNVMCRIQNDLCRLFDILPEDIKIARIEKMRP